MKRLWELPVNRIDESMRTRILDLRCKRVYTAESARKRRPFRLDECARTEGGEEMKHRIVYIVAALTATFCLTACAAAVPTDAEPTPDPAQNSQETADGVIAFNDDVLEELVREALGKPEGDVLASDALTLTELNFQMDGRDAGRRTIHNLDALRYFTNLTYLGFGYAVENESGPETAVDLSALSGLTSLESLQMGGVVIADVSALSNLTNLKSLSIWGGGLLTDVSPLAGLTKLEALTLRGNQIADISPLAGLSRLTYLDLEDNLITDVSPLASLTGLTRLFLAENPIGDYSPLVEIRANLIEWDFETDAQP